jgi:acyl-CoA synthetase (AMP-forming)/AMP-acid ligase II
MFGLMQDSPLLISSAIRHAARNHARTEIVSKNVDGSIHRYGYADLEARSRRLARVLQRLGIQPEDRVGTLAWNGYRHLELYYGVSGSGAICHTINPRLAPSDIAYIAEHAGDRLIFADITFAPLLAGIAAHLVSTLRGIVFLCHPAEMPSIAMPAGMDLLCYETLMEAADEDYTWPIFDERTAASLCYTSGTTGRPKGVLYSHRSTILHAMALNSASVFGLSALDRALPVVPMFHVNAWGMPYAAPIVGTALVMPGRHLDGASLATLMNEERVTFSAGVPTIWMGLLNHLRASGERLETMKMLIIGGSACPSLLIESFERDYSVTVRHAWGMSETSPLGSANAPTPATAGLEGEAALRHKLKQGQPVFGVDMRIVGDGGVELPWDGKAQGDLMVRGPWVASAYWGEAPGSACDVDGWFATGDVATIDENATMEITDRSKDVIKSGGEWISSIALENIAVSHPDVAEAAIVAAHHPKWDERPLLLVVAQTGRTIQPADILAFYEGKIAKWWLPDAVIVVDELPHTATGKLNKLSLRQHYRDYLAG